MSESESAVVQLISPGPRLAVWALAVVMPMTSKPISTIIISCIAVLAISCKISTFYWRYQVKMRKINDTTIFVADIAIVVTSKKEGTPLVIRGVPF